MNPSALIPVADSIPAPAWLFLVLDIATFTLHILVINVIVGGALIMLWNRVRSDGVPLTESLHEPITHKIPTAFALGVNLGVAPLLFLQVIYGHLFYTSSVLIGVYWLLVIPVLILAYYGAYVHARQYGSAATWSKIGLAVTVIATLYIGLVYVNNMTLMVQPDKWTGYFSARGGTRFNWNEATLIPRYLHFVAASIAIGGLFIAILWNMRGKQAEDGALAKAGTGMKIFAWASLVQVLIGVWFLLAIPREFMLQFMGRNLFATIVFMLGFLTALGMLITAFGQKLRPTLSMFIITILAMVITRHNLRAMYLENDFQLSSLTLTPQYGVMILFFVVLIAGLAAVGYMLRAAFPSENEEVAS